MKDTSSVALVTPMCIYRLANGLNLFSETVEDTGEEFVFDMTHTALLLLVQGPDGLTLNAQRASESPYSFSAGRMRVNKQHILAIQNTIDMDVLSGARQAASGLVLAKGPHR